MLMRKESEIKIEKHKKRKKREKSSAGCHNVPLKHFVDVTLQRKIFFTFTVHKDLCEKATKQQHRAL